MYTQLQYCFNFISSDKRDLYRILAYIAQTDEKSISDGANWLLRNRQDYSRLS